MSENRTCAFRDGLFNRPRKCASREYRREWERGYCALRDIEDATGELASMISTMQNPDRVRWMVEQHRKMCEEVYQAIEVNNSLTVGGTPYRAGIGSALDSEGKA